MIVRMWWQDLCYLDALCTAGTMSAAARSLRVDKATVSRRLATLEREAPGLLFEKRGGCVELTPYGARALAAYREHEASRLRLAAELERTEPDTQGSVRLTVPTFFASEIVVPALPNFLEAHPKLNLQVEGTNRPLDLLRGEADVAIRNLRPVQGGLAVRKVGRMGMAMYAARSYLARRGGMAAPGNLAGHHVLGYPTGPYGGPGFEWLPEAAKQAHMAFSANDPLPLRDAARAGLGMVPLPHFLGDEAPELVRVEGGGEGVAEIWLVTREEQRRVPRVRAVVQFLAELVRDQQRRLYVPARA
jgi:DNA-binding transcriptional LysR family regulator